jgi:hypothetical protein
MTTPTETEARFEHFIKKLRTLAKRAGETQAAEQELIDELHGWLKLAREREPYRPEPPKLFVSGMSVKRMAFPPLGVWRHYKGGDYTVIGHARYHDTDWPMVLYVSHEHGGVTVRPSIGHAHDRDGFIEPLPDGRDRFQYVGPQI